MFVAKLKALGHNIQEQTQRKANKWKNKPDYRDGYRFPSKKEAAYYDKIKLEQAAGHVITFLRQVPIHLAPGKTMYIDFLVFYADGSVRFIDVKGRATEKWLTQKEWAEQVYPFEIETV